MDVKCWFFKPEPSVSGWECPHWVLEKGGWRTSASRAIASDVGDSHRLRRQGCQTDGYA
jgi:hypothetical protein